MATTKLRKIGGINWQVQPHRQGLQFFPNKKEDIELAKRMGVKTVVDEIQKHLDKKFDKGDFKHAGGREVIGITFTDTPGQLIDRV
jgi:hypothetical protein